MDTEPENITFDTSKIPKLENRSGLFSATFRPSSKNVFGIFRYCQILFSVFPGVPSKGIMVFLDIPENGVGCRSLAGLGAECGARIHRYFANK